MIDTHAHLMFEQFAGDLDSVFVRAREAGVEKIVNVGCGVESSQRAVEMTLGRDFLYATVGLHPYDAADMSDALFDEWTDMISANKRIVAVGETGLDYFKARVERGVQQESFRRHLELALRTGLPVVVHNRAADDDCFSILREYPDVRAVFHCYGSSLEFARGVWAAGYLTSFTGIITYPNAGELRAVVRNVPVNLLMVETDCPFLAPQKYRGQRNEPAYVAEVVAEVASVKGLSLEEVEMISAENALRFFDRI